MSAPADLGERVAAALSSAGLAGDASVGRRLAAFLALLVQWNRVHNLTGITDVDALVSRLVVESLALKPLLRGTRIADVGSGAGVPGVPLAVTEPDRHFSLIESRAKRARFLTHVKGALELANVTVHHCRAEDLRAEDLPRAAAFDTVLARAVAPPNEVLQIARKLTGPGSVLIVPTSPDRRRAFATESSDFELLASAADARPGGVVLVLERRVP